MNNPITPQSAQFLDALDKMRLSYDDPEALTLLSKLEKDFFKSETATFQMRCFKIECLNRLYDILNKCSSPLADTSEIVETLTTFGKSWHILLTLNSLGIPNTTLMNKIERESHRPASEEILEAAQPLLKPVENAHPAIYECLSSLLFQHTLAPPAAPTR